VLGYFLDPNEVGASAGQALRLVPDAIKIGNGPAMRLGAALHEFDREVPVSVLPLPRAVKRLLGSAAE
jgi:hypothetical protein